MGRDADGIWFRSASPVVFQMQLVNTLEKLKTVILRNKGAVGSMLARRLAYQLLNLFPTNQFKFKIFWVDSDAHVRAMFELHRRYGSRDVMELLTEMQTVNVDAGGSTSSSRGGPDAIIAAPIQFANPKVGDDNSGEDFAANTNESSESSDCSEFVPESHPCENPGGMRLEPPALHKCREERRVEHEIPQLDRMAKRSLLKERQRHIRSGH
ncbi:hypothetical protein PIB30_050505 [Stylosanthes scabra]|uniref:Uncharacterized protein n=1 Tax=Stylosanthes scabra TaxID=79078 RepID=A0ABU6RIK5_9FABA|nr:hypothetical protein [Stylosanthes scabra]